LNSVEDVYLKISNILYIYKVVRYRMIQHDSNFVDIEFMQRGIKMLESVCKVLIDLKDGTSIRSKCFTLLDQLNQIDVLILSRLKEKMGEVR